MKKIVQYCLVAILGLSIVACGSAEPNAEESENNEDHSHVINSDVTGGLKLNSELSSLNWEVGFSNDDEDSLIPYNGKIIITDGSIIFENGNIVSGKFLIRMTTITAIDDRDPSAFDKTKDELVSHLRSNSYFNVEEYEVGTFSISDVQDGVIIADLTIKGNTNKEELKNVTVNTVDGVTTVTGTMTIDPREYKISFDSNEQKVFISEKMNLILTMVLS